LIWGFAEASFFFIIPDVLLSFIGFQSYKKGFIACGYALIGALAGGYLMFVLGANGINRLDNIFDYIPALSPEMIYRVDEELTTDEYEAILLGQLRMTPYKLYAAHAGAQHFNLLGVMLISIPARGLRFLLSALLIPFVAHCFPKRYSDQFKYRLLVLYWIFTYIYYFSITPW
jgi:membrane protein YqaA with SNARE-associated domain